MKLILKATPAVVLLVAILSTSMAPSPAQGGNWPPSNLVKTGGFVGTSGKGARSDTKRSWYDWDTLGSSVAIKRRERETPSSNWYEQLQDMSASFHPVDVRCVVVNDEIERIYVAGLYPDGDSCIEKWTFSQKVQGTTYVPISQRPLPIVKRSELFRGSSHGTIASLEPDPEERFVLFLTQTNPTVYRLALPSKSISVELTQAQQPYLAHGKQIVCAWEADRCQGALDGGPTVPGPPGPQVGSEPPGPLECRRLARSG